MAYAFIAGNGAGASANNDTVTTSAIDTSGANLLVAVAAFLNNITANPTLSDSKSNTWTLIHSRIHSILEVRIYAAIGSPTVGSGHTITLDGPRQAAV
jgi:hypothetical protein